MSPSWGEDITLRWAKVSEVARLLEIKASLAMTQHAPRAGEEATAAAAGARRGGFLLGSSEEAYRALCELGAVAVASVEGEVVGFASTMPDELLRQSALWERQHEVSWSHDFDPEPMRQGRIAYFDQLAISPHTQSMGLGAALCVFIAESYRERGHHHLLTTTLLEPRCNEAALPLIRKVGGRQVGTLQEHYEGVGQVISALHHIPLDLYHATIESFLADEHAFMEHAIIAIARRHVMKG